MATEYRDDDDLAFLGEMPSEDLSDLVYCLTHDKDGNTRGNSELLSDPDYQEYYPNHHQYWKRIASEIQTYGANTISTVLRGGKGVVYREVLTDVCDRLKVNYNKNSNTEVIETNLLMKILEKAFEKMTPEEIEELARTMGTKNMSGLSKQAMLVAFQAVFRAGGFMSYKLAVIIVNAVVKALVGKGLPIVANAALTKALSILVGPIGLAFAALWIAVDIAGPAFRVTVPAVIFVSFLRQKHLYGDQGEDAGEGVEREC